MHILIVEDDAAWLKVVQAMLERAGHRCSGFPDYRGALELIEGEDVIDLLLTDIQLPTDTPHGLSLARMAKLRRRRLPILFMTGDPELVELVDEDLGLTLIKPFGRPMLLEAVARSIARPADPDSHGPLSSDRETG
jgi:DNA-binding NtrC family response regulator